MGTLYESAMRGYQAADKMIKQARGYQAARKQYGDGLASDPGLYSAIQNVQNARHQDVRAQEQLQLNKNADQRSTQRLGIAQNQERRQQATFQTKQSTFQTQQRRDGVMRLVKGLRTSIANGQDPGAAFDSLSGALQGLGVDAKDIPNMRAQLVANPKILDSYYASLAGPGQEKIDAQKQIAALRASKTGKAGSGASASSPADVQAARQGAHDLVEKIRGAYNDLNAQGAMGNTNNSTLGNAYASARGSYIGRAVGGFLHTKAETSRQTIEGLIPNMIIKMKSASKLGARMFNSDQDMKMWLSAMSNPSQSYQTVNALLNQFEANYGRVNNGQAPLPIHFNNENYVQKSGGNAHDVYPGYVDSVTGKVFQGGDPSSADAWADPVVK